MSDTDDLSAPPRKRTRKAATPGTLKTPPQARSNWAGGIILAVLFIAMGAGAMYMAMPMLMKGAAPAGGAPAGGNPMAAMVMPVEAAKAERRTMTESVVVTASLRAQEQAAIKAEIAGRVVSIPFAEGQAVKKGDVLFKLDDSVQKAALAQAQADVNLSRNNVKRYTELKNSRAIAGVQVEEAQAQLNTATANVALARANLAKTTILAPFDGTAGIRNASVGDVVDASQDLVTVTQTKPLRVIFELPERFLPAVQLGQTVHFTVESHPNEQFEATINAVDSAIDPTTRGVRVQASAPNEDGRLMAGQFATLSFALASQTQALTVLDSAIVPEGGQFTVFKIGADETVQKTQVRVGLRDGTYAEILQGLSDGDTIVTAGQQKLFPGMKVKALPAQTVTVKPQPSMDDVLNAQAAAKNGETSPAGEPSADTLNAVPAANATNVAPAAEAPTAPAATAETPAATPPAAAEPAKEEAPAAAEPAAPVKAQ